MLKTTLSVLLLIILHISCQEVEKFQRNYPLVMTKSVTEITGEGVTFNGEISGIMHEEIIDYGFVWGKEDNLTLEKDLFKSIEVLNVTNFSTRIKSSLNRGTYYLRAFARTESNIIYGNLISFIAKGSSEPLLDIISISSTNLKECDTLIINWKNDILKVIDNIEINDIKYQTFLVQGNLIKVVPKLPTSSLKIKISSKNYFSEKMFEVATIQPKILSTFPSYVGPNDTIDIEFDYLPACTANAYVTDGFNFGQIGYINESNRMRLYFPSYCSIPNDFKFAISTSTVLLESPLISKKPNGWQRKRDSPVRGFSGEFSFSIGGKGYRGYYGNNLWEYSPVTDQWTEKGIIPPDISWNAGVFIINGKAYAGVGGGVQDLWEYEPITDTWRQMTSFPGPVRFQNTIFFAINGKGYVGGGQNGNNDWLKDFWEFDPAINQWTRKADLPQNSGFYPKAFDFNSLGYFVTLRQKDNVGDYYESYYYDPVKNEWGGSDQPIYPTPGRITGNTSLNSVFVFAGNTYIIISGDTYKIDLPSNQLTLVSCAPTKSNFFSFVINGRGYLGLGVGTEAVFEFDPSKL